MILLQKRPDGFTLVELMVVVAIIGILSGFSILTFQRQLRAERLVSISRAIQGNLETWRKRAMQAGGPCLIEIDIDNSKSMALFAPTLDVDLPVKAGSSTTKDVINACRDENPLNLHTVETGVSGLTLNVTPASTEAVLFSFRGLSEARLDKDAASTTSSDSTEFKISMTGLNEQRCIRILHPLGLIRAGHASTAQDDCSYQFNR